MDFVINNYIIFIILGVIFLMALIGYIADNTNFEKKPKKEKVKKDKKNKGKLVEETSLNNTNIETPKEDVANIPEPVDTNLDLNLTQDMSVSEKNEEGVTTEENETKEDTTNSNNDFNMMDSFEMPSELTDKTTDSIFTTPTEDLIDAANEAKNDLNNNDEVTNPVSDNLNANVSPESNSVDITEPNTTIESEKVNVENSTDNSSDDIWKF